MCGCGSARIAPIVSELVGRESDLRAITDWFVAGGPPTLVVEGAAGLGKTTLWAAAVAAIRGRGGRVLQTSPTEAESGLSYSGLADLLAADLPAVRSALPAPQARAVAVALRLEDPGDRPADETAVARGFLEALRALGRSGSRVLIAIDDLRWLDGPSLVALTYAARRLLPGEPIRILTTHRTGAARPPGLDERTVAQTLELDPLSVGSIHRIVRLRTGRSLPRPRLLEIHAAALGNPLHALELARTVATGGRLEGGSLASLFDARVAALPRAARHHLVLLAASADRSLARLDPCAGGDFAAGARPAVAAGLLTIQRGVVTPAHPLVTHVAYDGATDAERRRAHEALAETATDDEERALHLGRSRIGSDESAAAIVEAAARGARARGVRALAANLFESAARLTEEANVDARARRLLAASAAWFDSGDTGRVETILEPLIRVLPAGTQRSEARWRLGKALDEAGRWREAVALWNAAIDESDDLALRSQVHCSLAITAMYTDTVERAAAFAAVGVDEAERSGDQRSLGRALAVEAFIATMHRDERARRLMERALAIEAAVDESLDEWSPSALAAECARHTGDTVAARHHYRSVLDRATAAGDANVEQWAAFGLAWIEIGIGEYEAAAGHADLVLDIADQTGVMVIPARTLRAHVDAWLGRLVEARALVLDAIARATAADEATHQFGGRYVLGVIEGFEADLAAAARSLAEARRLAMQLGLAHASALRAFLAEAEIAAAAGEPAQAADALAAFDAIVGDERPRWADPLRHRADAAILAARGALEPAAAALESALVDPIAGEPDRGRAALALGTVLRRMREVRRAREATERALSIFERLGTPPWIDAARQELARLPGRRPGSDGGLTNAESAIAALVAAGRSNREVAAELVLSVKTVEVTLTRVYEKLGIRSRSELAASFRESAGEPL